MNRAPGPSAMKGRLAPAARWRSFRAAVHGLARLVRDEPNARIEVAAAALAIAIGVVVELPRDGWLWLTLAIALVLLAEAGNTALERLCDVAMPSPHPLVAEAKDVAAAGVLVAALAAGVIGALVLGPPLFALVAGRAPAA